MHLKIKDSGFRLEPVPAGSKRGTCRNDNFIVFSVNDNLTRNWKLNTIYSENGENFFTP